MIFSTTPSQTVGPFFAIGLPFEDGACALAPARPGAISVGGVLLDGRGAPVPDGLIETWQADAAGRFADMHGHGEVSATDGFRGFARCPTDDDGRWQILTVKPGALAGSAGGAAQAPHVDVSVFARGLLHRLVTRIYFADEAEANAGDPMLAGVPEARRGTLLAQPDERGYRFDIRLQGRGETVFFAV